MTSASARQNTPFLDVSAIDAGGFIPVNTAFRESAKDAPVPPANSGEAGFVIRALTA
jgi:hypothetical protein